MRPTRSRDPVPSEPHMTAPAASLRDPLREPILRYGESPAANLLLAGRFSDAAMVFGAGLAAFIYTRGTAELTPADLLVVGFVTLAAANGFHLFRLYRDAQSYAGLGHLFGAPVAALLAIGAAVPFLGGIDAAPLASWAAFAALSVSASRSGVGFAINRLRRSPRFNRRVLVIGDPKRIQTVLQVMGQRGGGTVVGVLGDAPPRPGMFAAAWSDIDAVMQRERIDDIILALPWGDEERVAAYLGKLREFAVDVHLFPDNIHPFLSSRGLSLLQGVPMARISVQPLAGSKAMAKAVEDKLLGSLLLLLLLPLLVIIAIAIRIDSAGPVLFRQKRYGFNNQIFTVFKFRTMHVEDSGGVVVQARLNDPRVTRCGRILRRTSLDELPQLLNVLNGTMSLVGPRPHAVEHQTYYQHLVDEYRSRHRMKPGITGLAQIKGYRGETQTLELMRKRVEYDIAYIETWSVPLDLWIIAMTPVACLRGTNAY